MNRSLSTVSSVHSAFCLAEALIALALSSVLFSILLVSSLALHRTFAAANDQVASHNEQLRVTDYLSRDLRSASNVSVHRDGSGIDITISEGNTGALSTNINLPVLGPILPAGSSPVTRSVQYLFRDHELVRTEDGRSVLLSQRLCRFNIRQTGARVIVEVAFVSNFKKETASSVQLTRAIWTRNLNG